MYFQWAQLIHAIPHIWKNQIEQNLTKSESNPLVLNHRLIKHAQSYFENSFPNYTFDWKQIYLLPWIITINSFQRNFQYKILHNILCLNKKLCIFGKIDSPLCSICHSNDETVALFCECIRVNELWSQVRIFFSSDLNLPLLTPQTAIFDFLVETDKCIFKITNHLCWYLKCIYVKVERKVLLILVV